MRSAHVVAIAGVFGALAACVSSDFRDGQFACDPTAAPACPPGLVCAKDGRCRARDVLSAPNDASAADARNDASVDAAAEAGAVLVGASTSGGAVGSTTSGVPTAFPFVAAGSGLAARLAVQLDATNHAPEIEVGLYDTYFDHPGDLLARGEIVAPATGWNELAVTPVRVSAGETYWIALFGKNGAEVIFNEDASKPHVQAEVTADANLSTLPAKWASGVTFSEVPLCAYATE